MKHPVDTSQWGEFVTKDLFGPSQLGKYHNPKNLQESETGYPYICASNLNNGINTSMPYVTGDDLKPTPTNIISWGKQCPYFTYHDTPCITSQGMYYINVADYSKLQIDFIITVLTALTREYNYTNCLIGKIFDELVLKLPLKPSADPSNYDSTDIDWDYMETVMRRVTTRAKERLASLPQPTDKKKTPVDTSSWGEFDIIALFDIINTKSIRQSDVQDQLQSNNGSTPYITASDKNNAILSYIDCPQEWIDEGNCIFIGGKTTTVTYQQHDFCSNDSHNLALYLKNEQARTKYIQLYLASILKKAFAKYHWGDALSKAKIKAETIKLPLKPVANLENYTQDDIDWDYMDNFMQAIEEKAHERVASLRKQI